MKLHKIAYSHDPDKQEYVVFKEVGGQDYSLATFKKYTEAEQWINQRYITLGKDDDYSLCIPFTICNETTNNQ